MSFIERDEPYKLIIMRRDQVSCVRFKYYEAAKVAHEALKKIGFPSLIVGDAPAHDAYTRGGLLNNSLEED